MNSNTFYSQHGEDFLLNEIFKGKRDGYFVEVGCLDGIEYSNSYHFEKKGWKGACIEAHNDFINSLFKNRPNSTIVHCAVGEDNKENVTFYANKVGSLSTLDKNEEERWKKNYSADFHGFEEQHVSMRTLTSIFDQLALKTIDFVSLDIEGYEVKALSGLDFAKYKPRVFVIEYKDELHKSQLDEILFKYKYHFLSHVGCNLFYSLEITDKKIVNANHGIVQLIRVDSNGVQHYKEIKLKKPSWTDKIKTLLMKNGLRKLWDHYRPR
ncbi:MAG TPA: FkbM family methyltransferase [Puia sp.]|nr:FkbM family methyltransferase [Puia sp.]